MSSGEGWNWPPPPPSSWPTPQPGGRRYTPTWVLLGVVTGVVATIGIPFLGILLDTGGQGTGSALGAVVQLGLLASLVGALVLGIFLVAKGATPNRRGFGLGLIFGWALSPIVFAGVCILLYSPVIAGGVHGLRHPLP